MTDKQISTFALLFASSLLTHHEIAFDTADYPNITDDDINKMQDKVLRIAQSIYPDCKPMSNTTDILNYALKQ